MNYMQHGVDGRRQQPAGGPIGMLVRGIAAGIGLASEGYQHHKEKNASRTGAGRNDKNTAAVPQKGPELHHTTQMWQQMDEAVWELDEAQDHVREHQSESAAAPDDEVADLAGLFLGTHVRLPPYYAGQLALPVIITQRRPESRTKGFVRAYSPLLDHVGIDQTTFLDFLDNLNKSLAPSPWIQAINLAAFAGQTVPEPFTIIISIAIKKVADAASELHSRSKTNRFLDQVNESFFAPRGLVALVLTWKPSQKDSMTTRAEFDIQSIISKASDTSKSRNLFQSSSGATSFEWPQMAPLVFPTLDGLANQAVVKRSGKFVSDYIDKRARARWAGENPHSTLANATGKEKFSSRYADPSHPASSGDPIALLTGGFIQAGFGRQSRNDGSGSSSRYDSQGLEGAKRFESSGLRVWKRGEEYSQGDGRFRIIRGGRSGALGDGLGSIADRSISPLTSTLVAGAKKIFQNDVLYLVVVQRPTEDQMAAAVERMASLG